MHGRQRDCSFRMGKVKLHGTFPRSRGQSEELREENGAGGAYRTVMIDRDSVSTRGMEFSSATLADGTAETGV